MISALMGCALLASPVTLEPALQAERPPVFHKIRKRKRRGSDTTDQRRPSRAPYYLGAILIIGDDEYSCANGTRPVLLKDGRVVCFEK